MVKNRDAGIEVDTDVLGLYNFDYTNRATQATSSGKAPRGETPKLNWDKVHLMRRLHAEGVTGRELSRMFEISTSVISRVLTRKTWT